MLAHFACVLVTALLFFGDPRFRQTYDVFALALAGSLISHFISPAQRASAPLAGGHAPLLPPPSNGHAPPPLAPPPGAETETEPVSRG
jgi:hypothetical protein